MAMQQSDTKSRLLALRAAMRQDDPRCRYCGLQVPLRRTSIDHIIPRCQGGSDDPDNLLLCCNVCNNVKANLLPHEWLLRLERQTAAVRRLVARGFSA